MKSQNVFEYALKKIRNAIFCRISEHFPTEMCMICSSLLDLNIAMTLKVSIVRLPHRPLKVAVGCTDWLFFSVTLDDVIKL